MPLAEDTILLKRYRVDGLLSGNETEAVYRAFDTNLSIPVIVKEKSLSSAERIAELKQQAVILSRLHHPGLAGIINHFSYAGKQYLVTDFIEGENLAERLEKQQPLAEREALDHIIRICQAVSYLHQQTPPVIHQDIRPGTVKVTPTGQAVLTHLGWSAIAIEGERSAPVKTGFSAPEQNRGPASDLYSLGATLYALLTGQAPPRSGKIKPPHTLNSQVSQQVSDAVTAALQANPADRPESVAAWQRKLESLRESVASVVPPEKEESQAAPAPSQEAEEQEPGRESAPDSAVEASHWLIDATGLGYSIGRELLLVGRHPDADVVIKDSNVSRYQAQIRVDEGRCLVQDLDSVNGTFLNGQRLGTDWYPLQPGDILTVGAARFHLTSTQPVKLASPKQKLAAVTEESLPPSPAKTDELHAPSARRGMRQALSYLIGIGLLGAIGLGIYLWGDQIFAALPATPRGDVVISQTETAAARLDQGTTQARSEAESTRQAQAQATVVQKALEEAATATANVPVAVIVSSDPTPTPTQAATPTRFPTPTVTATVRPSRTPPRAAPAAAGPTLVPLEFNETLDRIGVREVVDVDINPRNPAEVYIVVKRDGIYKSSNGGDGPWAKMTVDATGVVAFVIDPTNPARFYAPTWNAVLKSIDGGNSWEAKTNGLLSNRAVDVLTVDPKNPNRLYAGVGETLVVSTNGGETWTSIGYGEGLGLARLHAIVVDPFAADTVYVAGLGAAIYKSTDGGHNFLPMPYNVGEGAFGLAAHPSQKGVYLAGINSAEAAIVKTESGWEFDSVSEGLVYGGADSAYSAIAYAPGNPRIVYAGSGYEENRLAKGIFKSVNGGESWSPINNGLSLNPDFGQPYYVKSMVVHPTNPDVVLAATGGGLFKSVDGGANWTLR